MKAIFLSDLPEKLDAVYTDEWKARIRETFDLQPGSYTRETLLQNQTLASEAEVIFSTWGMPAFTAEEIGAYFPALRAVFYGAGSVQGFAKPFLENGVRISSAWIANAIPVAEFCVAQMVLASKGMFGALIKRPEAYDGLKDFSLRHPGMYNLRIGIIGAGAIGREVIRQLRRNFPDNRLKILVYSQSMTAQRAGELDVVKASLEEIFSQCDIISNHLANNAQTEGMLDGALFARMKPHAVFINTGRGAQVVEDALIAALAARPDACALLDVTWPEPPAPEHPFYRMPNVFLTPHIAGSQHQELSRMAAYMLADAKAFLAGQPMKYEVTLPMLERMA